MMKKLIYILLTLGTLLTLQTIYTQVTQEWVAIYNITLYNNIPNSIAVDSSGNVYVTGQSAASGLGNSTDYATIKYNSSGVQQWVQRYNGPGMGNDYAYSIAVDVSGNVYVTGWSTGKGTNYDYATIKYNSSGIQQWLQRYNGPVNGRDGANSLAIDGSGNVYVTGVSYRSSFGIYDDYTTIKYNSAGDSIWVRRYNGPGNREDYANSLAVDGSGNVYVTGYSRTGQNFGTEDYATVKYNSAGVQQWVARYNGPGNDYDDAHSIAVDGSGNVYVTGYSYGSGTNYDYATLKYNSSGAQQWVQRYNGLGNREDFANSIDFDSTGNVYVTGVSWGSGTDSDYATIKYNSSGAQEWIQRYNGTGNALEGANSIAIDGLSNVYVTGNTLTGPPLQYYRYATIKYSPIVGIQPISNEIPGKLNLSQNFPNPFNPSTKIRFDIPLSRGVDAEGRRGVLLVIYDILGREVTTLVNEQLNPGTYEAEFSGENYPSGVYYYRLQTDQYNETLKMILLR